MTDRQAKKLALERLYAMVIRERQKHLSRCAVTDRIPMGGGRVQTEAQLEAYVRTYWPGMTVAQWRASPGTW